MSQPIQKLLPQLGISKIVFVRKSDKITQLKSLILPLQNKQTEKEIIKQVLETTQTQQSLKAIQTILTLLTIELLFHRTIKTRIAALMGFRAIMKEPLGNPTTMAEAIKASKWGHFCKDAKMKGLIIELDGLASKIGPDALTSGEYSLLLRICDRQGGLAFSDKEIPFLNFFIEQGAENEKLLAQCFLNEFKKRNYLSQALSTQTWADSFYLKLGRFFKINQGTLAQKFYCASSLRVSLFNLTIEDLTEHLLTERKINCESFNRLYTTVDLDQNFKQRLEALAAWENQLPELSDHYKKLYDRAKQLIEPLRNKIELYGTYLKLDSNLVDCESFELNPAIVNPGEFQHLIEHHFPHLFKKVEEVVRVAKTEIPKKIKEPMAAARATASAAVSERPSIPLPPKTWAEIAAIPAIPEIVKKPLVFPYDPRVLRWFLDQIPEEYASLSPEELQCQRAFHSFSPLVDDYAFGYGIELSWYNQIRNTFDRLIVIPAEMTFTESAKTHRGVITICVGADRKIYHRHFTPNVWCYDTQGIAAAFRRIDALQGEEVKESVVLPKNIKDSVSYHPVLRSLHIEDARNKMTITLFWTPRL